MGKKEPAWRPAPTLAYKSRDAGVTSAMMSAVRGRENRAEVALRKALWKLGYRYRLQSRKLPGKPDIVFPKYRTVVFVDGDFWHGRALREGGERQLRLVVRGPRFEWWRDKLARNVERDDEVTRALESDGWIVVRVWEAEVIADLEKVVVKVDSQLQMRPLRGE